MACACEHCGHEFEAEPEGGHRLLCGDSTSADTVAQCLDKQQPVQLCLTDPPYGLAGSESTILRRRPNNRSHVPKNTYVEYDDSRDSLITLIANFLPLAQAAAPVIVLTPGNGNQLLYPPPSWTMAWFTPAGIGRGPWGFSCWQPILCYGKDPKLSDGEGCYPDAIVHTEMAEKNGHPCPKPVKFWCWLIERTSKPGWLIYDPFSGSGTTIVATEITGRCCSAIEISPAYCDVAVKRWSKFTGRSAVLTDDGRTFDQLAEARGVSP